jgi:uncharacterized protein (DUF1800 family)
MQFLLTAPERILRRFSYGPMYLEIQRIKQIPLSQWLDEQLLPNIRRDDDLDVALAAATYPISYPAGRNFAGVNEPNRKFNTMGKSAAELNALAHASFDDVPVTERSRALVELNIALTLRRLWSTRQVEEMLVEFWLDHFYVAAASDFRLEALMPLFERMVRANALGNFSTLLQAVARQPSMLIYLDNAISFAPAPNENYARELFELHTLGAQVFGAADASAAYTEDDIKAAAQVFSGWSFGYGQAVAGRTEKLASSGEFVFVPEWHVAGEKLVLGAKIADSGVLEGEALLSMLARHPSTAKNLAFKLCKRFIADQPPAALVQFLADSWAANVEAPDQIAKVMRALITESVKYEAQIKFRRPQDYMLAVMRPVRGYVRITPDFSYTVAKTGHRLFAWPSPDGYPDIEAAWLSRDQLNSRFNIVIYMLLANQRYGESFFNPQAWSELAEQFVTIYATDAGMQSRFNVNPPEFDYSTRQNKYFSGMQDALYRAFLHPHMQYR